MTGTGNMHAEEAPKAAMTGKYTIERAGAHRDSGDLYLYDDGQYRFYFELRTSNETDWDARLKPIDGKFSLYIVDASKTRLEGGDVHVDPADVAGIEANIRDYFEKFDCLGRPITSENPGGDPLAFLWKLGQLDR